MWHSECEAKSRWHPALTHKHVHIYRQYYYPNMFESGSLRAPSGPPHYHLLTSGLIAGPVTLRSPDKNVSCCPLTELATALIKAAFRNLPPEPLPTLHVHLALWRTVDPELPSRLTGNTSRWLAGWSATREQIVSWTRLNMTLSAFGEEYYVEHLFWVT